VRAISRKAYLALTPIGTALRSGPAGTSDPGIGQLLLADPISLRHANPAADVQIDRVGASAFGIFTHVFASTVAASVMP